MKILVAPNAFKGSATAAEVACGIAEGLKDSCCEVKMLPVADGGDGTLAVLQSPLNLKLITTKVKNAYGDLIRCEFGLDEGSGFAVIELAEASGLKRVKVDQVLDPTRSTTFGTGQQIVEALACGAKRIILTVGGSATVDGAVGILEALGVEFYDQKRKLLQNISPAQFLAIERIDTHRVSLLHDFELEIFCDVTNPLSGNAGAAAVFAPQKGAHAAQVAQLEAGLLHLVKLIHKDKKVDVRSVEGGGAAGGVAAVLYGLLGAKIRNGADAVLDAIGFDAALADADLVITGEGKLDRQTLRGKAPMAVAKRAKRHCVPVVAFAGKVEDQDALSDWFQDVIEINDPSLTLKENMEATQLHLRQQAAMLAKRRNLASKENQ